MTLSLPAFVREHQERWKQLEVRLDRLSQKKASLAELEDLDRLYRATSADLSVGQTFYPQTDAHRFLNALCARAYGMIYQAPRDRLTRARAFFRIGFPRTVRANLPYVAVSFALLALGIALGAVVVALEPQGAQLLVPVGMREAVAQKRMWTDGMLSVAPPSFHASMIATNNLSVTLIVFASGLLLGIGPIFLMLNNGLLLGAVFAHCIHEGMGWPLLSFIGAHGPVELTTIVLAGAAGLMVGQALLDPGERTRAERLRERGVEAVQLVLGSAPFLGLIGIVEGFVSPGDRFPGPAKVVLGLALGICFWTYLALVGRADTATRSARRSAR